MNSFRTTLLASLATALIGFAAPAFADNSAYILQTGAGYNNVAVQDQSGGDGNNASSVQIGAGHSASIAQSGNSNSGATDQTGTGHYADISQVGDLQIGKITQTGANHFATVTQEGDHGNALISQFGQNNYASVHQH